MKRIALVFLFASALCLAITGLRVAVLRHIAAPTAPESPLVAPRPADESDPLSDDRPVEYVAGTRAPASPSTQAGLLWLGVLREAPRGERRGE